ncbi:SMP-30/gluconolactonase/LRE family protein [Halalkalibacter oceani]|uniref:SMP-30/gluconolactonase/LRE family protein n=1 Tax=Halalkalibacter oceani TaxID=1653776 RepID=UPI0033959C4D
MKATLRIDAKSLLGEGPCWDGKSQRFYWVDILGKTVHCFQPETETTEVTEVGDLVGAVVVREQGGLLVATQTGFYTLDEATGEAELISNPEPELADNRFNDGKCDPAGRFWAGTMDIDEQKPSGSLYVLHPDRTVEQKLSDITISNGLAWSSDRKTMYYIDSPTKQVNAFDYELATGEITNKRVVVTIPEGEGIPDGMTIDQDDMLWVAQWGGYKVSRWNPRTGERIGEVAVPAKQVTSCCFGGEQLDELFITTARRGLSEEELQRYPHSGGVFHIKPGVKGTPSYSFKG